MVQMLVIIENLEECPSPWLMSEYRYVADLFNNEVIFTNVKGKMRKALEGLGKVHEIGFDILADGLSLRKVIILDPSAGEELTHQDLRDADAVVIGGIMGDYPPKERTKTMITSRFPRGIPRNLGKKQLTIAGAAYVLKKVMEGRKLNELEIREGLTYTLRLGGAELVIELPYAFPYEGGEPVLPPNYLEVVALRSVYYEGAEEC